MIDSHCHFDFEAFDESRSSIWQRCKAQGLDALLIPGVEPQQWLKASALCREYADFYYAAGLHPWWLSEGGIERIKDVDAEGNPPAFSALFDLLVKQLDNNKCIAVGECGLDKARIVSGSGDQNWQKQLDVFKAHVDIAKQVNYPMIIHSVKAHAEVMAILKAAKLDAGGVIHAFTGSREIAQQYWQLGFYLGIGGAISYERARKTRDAVKTLPIDALLLETDAPSMPLKGQQGKNNSPENLPLIVKEIAKLKGLTEQEVTEQSTQNFYDLFQLRGRAK